MEPDGSQEAQIVVINLSGSNEYFQLGAESLSLQDCHVVQMACCGGLCGLVLFCVSISMWARALRRACAL